MKIYLAKRNALPYHPTSPREWNSFVILGIAVTIIDMSSSIRNATKVTEASTSHSLTPVTYSRPDSGLFVVSLSSEVCSTALSCTETTKFGSAAPRSEPAALLIRFSIIVKRFVVLGSHNPALRLELLMAPKYDTSLRKSERGGKGKGLLDGRDVVGMQTRKGAGELIPNNAGALCLSIPENLKPGFFFRRPA